MILSALMLAAGPLTSGAAIAQDAGKPQATPQQTAPQQAAPQQAPAPQRTAAGSPLAQVPFTEQPFPLRDGDGSYKEFLNKVAADVGRRCGKQENYGWEFRKGDQEKMDRIFQGTMDNFSQAGWAVGAAKSRSIPDPETAAYVADKDKRRLLLIWVPMSDAALLLMCETEAPAPKK
ncbi:hypothetical protein [Azospirillum sp. sgz302134]